jgi:excisionase family DNA binding protein
LAGATVAERTIPLERDPTPIRRKIVVRSSGGGYQVYMDAQERPFSRLAKDALLDTADLCQLFGCSSRTVYRWMAERKLRWDRRVGREYLFCKDDVLEWWADNRPPLGRPPKKRGRR